MVDIYVYIYLSCWRWISLKIIVMKHTVKKKETKYEASNQNKAPPFDTVRR
jgi:hypothetical protein